MDKESETFDMNGTKWARKAFRARGQGNREIPRSRRDRLRSGGRPFTGVFRGLSQSLQRSSRRRLGHKPELLDYQRNCLVYRTEKALVNTEETKEI
jgi:hypothetical protein